MVVKLTRKEMINFVSIGMRQVIDQVIIRKEKKSNLADTIIRKLNESDLSFKITAFSGPPADKKIQTIKTLRKVVGYEKIGLADAKCAVENWPKWIKAVREFNKIPVIENHWNNPSFSMP